LVYQLNPCSCQKSETMKNIYSGSVKPYGCSIKKRMTNALAGPIAGVSHLRLILSVISGFILIFNTTSLRAQNCPTSGTHIQNANENTYYPGSTASVAAGATSVTLGAAGSATDDNGFDKIDHAVIAGLAVVGAVAGSVSGYFIGRRAKRTLIYENK